MLVSGFDGKIVEIQQLFCILKRTKFQRTWDGPKFLTKYNQIEPLLVSSL